MSVTEWLGNCLQNNFMQVRFLPDTPINNIDMRNFILVLLTIFLVSCTTEILHYEKHTLYYWLRGGKSKTKPYKPKDNLYERPRCQGCKHDPSIWL